MIDERGRHPSLTDLLERQRADLVRYVARAGRGLMRYESAEDLAQGTILRALNGAAHFEYRGDSAFAGWIRTLGRQHIAERARYWRARKRNAGPVLRVTLTDRSEPGSGVNPPGFDVGPVTFADRRAQMEVATRALDLLPARDRELLESIARGHSIKETAERLGISGGATQRAHLRAQARFRQTYELIMRQHRGNASGR